MLGSDKEHRVKVEMNGEAVLNVVIESPYKGAQVKEAIQDAYDAVRQGYVQLSRSLSFIKNNEALGRFSRSITAAQLLSRFFAQRSRLS